MVFWYLSINIIQVLAQLESNSSREQEGIRISGKWNHLLKKIQSLKALGIDCVINVKKYCLISSPRLKGRYDRKVMVSGGQAGILSQKPGIHHAEGRDYIWWHDSTWPNIGNWYSATLGNYTTKFYSLEKITLQLGDSMLGICELDRTSIYQSD